MRNITPELEAHFAGGLTSLATCWHLTRQDGFELGFTDHDAAIEFEGMEYSSIAGFTPTAIESKSNMAVDNLDIEGQLYATKITEEDLLAGLYDYAKIEIFVVNYNDLTQGKMVVKKGVLGEVNISDNMFQAEMRGLTQHLSQTIGEVFSPNCRAILGDNRCKADLSAFTISSIVTAVNSRNSFESDSLTQEAGYFTGGEVIFTSNNNIGRRMEVKEFEHGKITLALGLGKEIQVGDQFDIIAGCDKTKQTCISKFNNIINFRGEPDVPGTDKILTTSGTIK